RLAPSRGKRPAGCLPRSTGLSPFVNRDSVPSRAFRRVAGALQGNSLSQERTCTMRRISRQLGILIVAASALRGVDGGPVHADAVTDWNAIMQATVTPTNPFFQARSAAIVQLAVFEAVNAVVGDYEPYLGTIAAPRWASPDAAAIAAAHRALVNVPPARDNP